MPRAHWLILAIGVAVMLFVSLSPDQRPPVTESLLPAPEDGLAEELGEPDLLLESAVISQFRRDGSLHYRLHADRITHYPSPGQTVLRRPRLMLDQGDAPPWELSANRGRILGGALLPEVQALAGTADASEIVLLEDEVLIRRERTADRFVDLQTSLLRLYPQREYAETDRPVIIRSGAGQTTAGSLQADLAAGRMILAAAGEDRVHTTLAPEHLP